MLNLLFYATTVAIWGSTWLVITFQLQDAPPAAAVAWRFLLAGAILLCFCALRKISLRLSPAGLIAVGLQGLANFSLNYWMVYLAEARIPSGLVAVIFSMLLPLNMVGAALLFGQRISLRAAGGAALGIAGIILVFWPEVSLVGLGAKAWAGVGFSLAGTCFSAVGNLLSVKTQKMGIGVVPTLTIGMVLGGLAMLMVAAVSGAPLSIPLTPSFLLSLLYLSLFGSVIAFFAYLTLIGRVGAGRASYNGVVIPIVALLLSSLFEGYQWNVPSVIGLSLAVLGNLLVMRAKNIPQAEPERQ